MSGSLTRGRPSPCRAQAFVSASRAARSAVLIATSTMVLAACADEITNPAPHAQGTLTVAAATGYGYVSLEEGRVLTTPADPSASAAWDLAVFSTTVTTNGGAAGPARIETYCLCRNAGASPEAVLAMTPDSELADFETVDASDIPASGWATDALTPAITGWVSGTGASASAVPDKFWKVRLDDSSSFAKVRVVSLTGATASHAGTVRIEYAVQETATAAFGPMRTMDVALGGGPVSVDLNAGAVVPPSAPTWDLRFDGYTIRVNSGVSGPGRGGAAVPDAGETFADATTAVTTPQAYRADRYTGVFGASPWYRYNLTGQHRIHPTFDVYLLRRGSTVYKLQLLDYYGPAGEPRHITFRYERIAG